MDCASCVAHVEKAAGAVPGVQGCRVNLALGRATVQFDAARTNPTRIAAAITDAGYPAAPETPGVAAGNVEEDRLRRQQHEARAWFRRWMVGLILWLPLELYHWASTLFGGAAHAHQGGGSWLTWASAACATAAVAYLGWAFYRSAWAALRRGTSNMDTLIAMGASVAYGYSLVALAGYLLGLWQHLPDLYFMESTGLLALISLGHWLEARAREAAGSAIRELLNLAPAKALRLRDGNIDHPEEVPVAELNVGDVVLVRPGDKIPTDGVVESGQSSVDVSMLTGE